MARASPGDLDVRRFEDLKHPAGEEPVEIGNHSDRFSPGERSNAT
jgi:hypothetical protein